MKCRLHLILGAILASLVVLLFMRNWRATVIAAVAIPASVISTFGAMYWLNFTLNNITMLALVLMVGVVIDDAIVVLENIFRFIEEKQDAADAGRGASDARHRTRRDGDNARASSWSFFPCRSCRRSPAGSSTPSASPRPSQSSCHSSSASASLR